MKRIATLLCFMVCCAVAMHATNANVTKRTYTVRGTVKDRMNAPVPYATVMVLGTNIGIAADVDGGFRLQLDKGTYRLRFSCTGYEQKIVEVSAEQQPNLEVTLDEAKNGLTEVVVTGTRTERMLKDEPVVTRVITAEEIKKLDPQDFKGLLEYELPGLQFNGAAHGSGLPNISFQGMDSRYLLFLIDGERMAGEGALDNIDFSRLDVDNIERIEVIKGSMSTLYGSNALGGVVNIITKKANRPFVGNVSARTTSLGDQKYALSVGTRQEKFSSLTSASFSRRNPYTIRDTKPMTSTFKRPDGTDSTAVDTTRRSFNIKGYETFSIAQKFGYDFTDRLSAELTGSFYQNRLLYTEEMKLHERFRDFTFGGKLGYILNENSRLDLSYHYDHYYKNDIFPQAGDLTTVKYRDVTHNIRLNYSLLLADRHALTAGTEYNTERMKSNWFRDTTSSRFSNCVIYVQDDYRVTDRLSLVGGLRMDYHSEYKAHVSPKLSAMYHLGHVTLRGGYAAGFRSPSLRELYAEFDHRGMFKIYGNTNLKPETSHHASVSAEWVAGIFNASATGYYNWFNNRIVRTVRIEDGPAKQYPDYIYQNAEKSKTYGFDVNAQVRLPFDLTLRGTYSYVNDDEKVQGKRSSYIRPHTAVMQADYTRRFGRCRAYIGLNGRWMAATDYWSYSSSQKSMYKMELESRMLWKLNAGCYFPRGIALNVGVDNLFNAKDKNISYDASSATLTRGTEFIANISVNIAELIGK